MALRTEVCARTLRAGVSSHGDSVDRSASSECRTSSVRAADPVARPRAGARGLHRWGDRRGGGGGGGRGLPTRGLRPRGPRPRGLRPWVLRTWVLRTWVLRTWVLRTWVLRTWVVGGRVVDRGRS